ncbi:hypothetical protein LUX57_10305 [Actinomadura madurae]|nr:hypothetical protein [Actinomadura madurae]
MLTRSLTVPPGDGRREPVVVTGQPAGHEAAVAVARHREPVRIREPLGDEPVERFEEVGRVLDAPAAADAVVERLAVPVAAARIDQQHRPAAGDQLLVVEVDLVRRRVPRVVRAAVHVEKHRPRAAARGIVHQPCLHRGAVGDGEPALLAGVQVDVGERGTMVAQHGLAPGRQVHDRDLTERRGGGERERRAAATGRQPRDDPAGPGDDRACVIAPGRDRPQVGAAVVAQAEHDPALVFLWQTAGIGGSAGHHVAVERPRQVGGLAAGRVDAVQAGVPGRVAGPADHEQRRAVGDPADGGGDPVGEGEHAWPCVRCVHLQQVDRRAVAQVAVGAGPAGEGEDGAVRRPGQGAGALRSVGDLTDPAAVQVQDVQVPAYRAAHPLPVGLVVEAVGDHRRPRAAGRVDRRGEGEPAAVRAPVRSPGSERQIGQPFGLASSGVEHGHLTVAEERDPASVRRPGRRGVGRTGGEAPGCGAVRADQPQPIDGAVVDRVQGPENVRDPAPVRRQRRKRRDGQVGEVLDAQSAAHGSSLVGGVTRGTVVIDVLASLAHGLFLSVVRPGTAASSSRVKSWSGSVSTRLVGPCSTSRRAA